MLGTNVSGQKRVRAYGHTRVGTIMYGLSRVGTNVMEPCNLCKHRRVSKGGHLGHVPPLEPNAQR